MSKPGCDTPLRGNGKLQDVWKVQWTWAAGVAVFDKTQSDVDPTFAQSLIISSGGAGITNVRFPKSSKVNILSKNLVTDGSGANQRIHEVTDQVPTSGTCKVRYFDPDAAGTPAALEPANGSRYQLILLLDG